MASRDPDWVPLNQREKLSYPRLFAIAAGWFGNSINWTLIFALATPMMEKVKITGIPSNMVWFAGAVVCFILQPLSGSFSDQCTFRWGRRRIWIIGSTFVDILAMCFVMFCIEIGKGIGGQEESQYLGPARGFFVAGFVLWYAGASVFQGPMRALASDSCPAPQQMLMSNICNIINCVAALLSNLIGALSLYKYTSFSQEQFVILIGTILSIVCIIISCIAAPEEPLLEKPPNAKNPLVEIWVNLKNIPKPVLFAAIEYLLAQCAFYMHGVYQTAFFARDVYGGNNAVDAGAELNEKYQDGLSFAMMVACIMNGTNFLFGFANTWIIDKIGIRFASGISMGLASIVFLIVLWIREKYVLLVLWLVLGIAQVMYNTIPNGVTAICCTQDQLAAMLGIVNSFNVVGQQIGNFVLGMGVGSAYGSNPPPNKLIMWGCIPGAAAAIFGFFLIDPKPANESLDNDDMDDNDDKADEL